MIEHVLADVTTALKGGCKCHKLKVNEVKLQMNDPPVSGTGHPVLSRPTKWLP